VSGEGKTLLNEEIPLKIKTNAYASEPGLIGALIDGHHVLSSSFSLDTTITLRTEQNRRLKSPMYS
jgi:hypothetical protein